MTTNCVVRELRTLTPGLAMAALVGSFAAAPAAAQTAIYTGGATLPSSLARALFDCAAIPFDTNGNGVRNDADRPADCTDPAGSFDADLSNVQFGYASVGSGGGVSAFINNAGIGLTFSTPPQPTDTATPGGTVTTYPYPDHHLSLSEATLSSAQLATYNAGVAALNGPAIQVPFVGTSVTMGVNTTGLNIRNAVPVDATSGMRFSLEQYCALWGGYPEADNWNDVLLRSTNKNARYSVASLPVIRVVRTESSGTTFIFSSRMAEQCALTPFPWPYTVGTTVNWATRPGGGIQDGQGNQGVAAIVSGAVTDTNPAITGTNAVPVDVNGDGTVDYADGIGRIGYISPAFVEPSTSNGVVTVALATRSDPNRFVGPSIDRVNRGLKLIGPPAVVTDPLAWGALQGNGTDGVLEDIEYPAAPLAYPIIGFNYADLYTCYQSGIVFRGVRGFFNYYLSGDAQIRDIVRSFDFVPLGNSLRLAARDLIVNDPATRVRRAGTPEAAGVCSTGA